MEFSIDWILASGGDFDNDGIDDAREGLTDLDGDITVAEYVAGTDPNSAVSHFHIDSWNPSNGGWPVSISFEGKSGRFYSLLRTTNSDLWNMADGY